MTTPHDPIPFKATQASERAMSAWGPPDNGLNWPSVEAPPASANSPTRIPRSAGKCAAEAHRTEPLSRTEQCLSSGKENRQCSSSSV